MLIISDLGSGGAQRVLVVLAEAWHKRGRRVAVVTWADSDAGDFFALPAAITRVSIGSSAHSRSPLGGLAANIARVLRLRWALRRLDAPVAVAFVAHSAVLTVLAAFGLGIRVVASERNDPDRQSFGPLWDALRRFAYRRADRVTANSRGALESLARFVSRDRLAYVPNPLPSPPASSPVVVQGPTILSVGRLNRQKAHDVLLRAFARFAPDHPGWRLAIVGEGPEERRLRSLANDLGISVAVDWLGQRQEPWPWLRAARIFALPSRHEGTPNALLEAMTCGLPCVVSDASSLLELVEHGVSGLVVPVEDVAGLAAALARLADDPRLARRLGDAARGKLAGHAPDSALAAWEAAIGGWPDGESRLRDAKRAVG